jgi:hypothetical protein
MVSHWGCSICGQAVHLYGSPVPGARCQPCRRELKPISGEGCVVCHPRHFKCSTCLLDWHRDPALRRDNLCPMCGAEGAPVKGGPECLPCQVRPILCGACGAECKDGYKTSNPALCLDPKACDRRQVVALAEVMKWAHPWPVGLEVGGVASMYRSSTPEQLARVAGLLRMSVDEVLAGAERYEVACHELIYLGMAWCDIHRMATGNRREALLALFRDHADELGGLGFIMGPTCVEAILEIQRLGFAAWAKAAHEHAARRQAAGL